MKILLSMDDVMEVIEKEVRPTSTYDTVKLKWIRDRFEGVKGLEIEFGNSLGVDNEPI